jgi:excisionase family DNA binding protein
MTAAVLGIPANQMIEDGFATVPEAAHYLRLSRAKIYLLMDDGSLKYAKFGRSRRIPWRAVKEFAAASLVAD